MKINDILNEASDDSGDYQQMLAFTRANRVGGVPDDQQIPLALFKELKKQQQQNQALGAELDAAEQRIDQATQSGELSQKELGMHRTELDRERAAGDQQKAAVTQLGQQYSEREKASTEQIKQLTGQLDQVRNMPGIDKKAAEDLEKKIKELGEKSVPADRLAELESTIAQIQTSSIADDDTIKDLVQQVKDAQAATDTRVDMVTKMRQDIERLRQVEQGLRNDVDKVADQSEETTATVYDIETKELPWAINNINQLKTKVSMDDIPPYAPTGQQVPTPPPPTQQQAPAPEPTPEPASDTTQDSANQPVYTPSQLATAKKLGLSGDLQDPNLKFAESAFARSVAWATGKPL
jgi:membrane-associated HD superfamily phosphohydrolase